MSWAGSGIGRCATVEERAAALAVAHAVLVESWPRVQVSCRVSMSRYGLWDLPAQAVFRLPGVVRVTLRSTGELIAQSMPGKPLVLDQRAKALREYGCSDAT